MPQPIDADDLWSARVPSQPAVSADGTRVVFVLGTLDRAADRPVHELWSTTVGGDTARLTAGPADRSPGFLADGSVSFVRADAGPPQVWRIPADGGEPAEVTTPEHFPLGVLSSAWSPDAKRLAVVTLGAFPDPTAPLVVGTAFNKADGLGRFGDLSLDLVVLDVESGERTRLVSGLPTIDGVTWSPDGTTIAFATHRDDRWDTNFTGVIETVDTSAPESRKRLCTGLFGMGTTLRFTPDGSTLIAVGRQDISIGHAHLLAIDPGTGQVRRIAPELDRNVLAGPGGEAPGAPPRFGPDGLLYFAVREHGLTHLYAVDWATPDAAATRVFGSATESVDGLDIAESGRLAFVKSTVDRFPEIVVLDGGKVVHRTELSTFDTSRLLAWHERWFEISDGVRVQGWLMRPRDADGPTPLLLDIHGGPHAAWSPLPDANFLYRQEFAERGWSVLLLNPRGSDGYGEDFFTAVVGGWGANDAADFLEPVATLVAEGLVDKGKVAVTGYSYGGFATLYLSSHHPDVFAAAVAGGVVSDLATISGTSDLPHYFSALEMAQGEDIDLAALRAVSPIAKVRDVTAPTLIMQGADDQRCPVGQAEQWFVGLRETGVPTRLVLYPGASHLFVIIGRPSQRVDYRARLHGWLAEHVR